VIRFQLNNQLVKQYPTTLLMMNAMFGKRVLIFSL